VTTIKLSVLLFYYRLFRIKLRLSIITFVVLSIIWWIVVSLTSAFQCTPVQKAWDHSIPGTCIRAVGIFIVVQVVNIVLDIAILCLPISVVLGLRLSKAKKYSVAGTFALGGLWVLPIILTISN
jgi:hypothetical protein